MSDQRYVVIAECIDARTGKRFAPGDEFLPAPDRKQAIRLLAANCIEEIDAKSPELPTDELDTKSATQLTRIAKAEKVDVSGAGDVPAMIALIRAARTAAAKPDYDRDSLKTLALDQADKDQLLVIAAYEQAEVPQGDAATPAELIAAIRVKRGD